ncbi:MAG: DsbA family oxidoreductase [Proteobacteria bacterium]|nr:DsbA family oxidoreductase [Pseudomonadota bacterium]MBU1398151.1 DsbA family oxidoreductase [Pseudomonadota bacterium]MBU1570287.1 DsbA family oxidoreductase [Pseudomonadota bacterium]
MTSNSTLEIFSDYIWPWCYFITVRIEQLKREYDIAIRWRAFSLHPDTPEEGLLLEQLFANYPVDVKKMMRKLHKTADDLGLPLGERERTYNSRMAQELGLWAESKNKGDVFHNAVFRAYFADGKNIAKTPVLLDLTESAGLPREEAAAVLATRAFKEAVDEDWDLSRKMGITAVPTFVMKQDKLVGAQPYDMLERLMAANGIKKRS